MGKFREHGVMLFLDNELYVGFIKLQAERKLGRSFAGLLPFIEGLYQMGYISSKVYEHHKQKYSQPLLVEESKVLTKEEQKEKQEEEKLNKTLELVADQWEIHPSVDWRNKWIDFAKQHPELANAKRVLALSFDTEEPQKTV